MHIYLKTACIMFRRIYTVLREPLQGLLAAAAFFLVPLGEGSVLWRPLVDLLGPVTTGSRLGNWWIAGMLVDIAVFLVLLLMYGVVRLWLSALREAQKSDCL